MAVESWLHGVSFDIIRSTIRLKQCYHDDPLLRSPSNFIYTCVPNTNAPYLKNLRQQWCYHTRYGGREITSRPATAHNRDTSSSVASPSRLLTLAERFNHRLHMYTKHKCVMFEELGHHGVTIHGMSIESWPPGPPQVITRTPRRVLHHHHNDGDFRSAPNVVYTYIPNTNAPHLKNWDYAGVVINVIVAERGPPDS